MMVTKARNLGVAEALAEQLAHEQQVGGGADRQELGDRLDDAEEDGGERSHAGSPDPETRASARLPLRPTAAWSASFLSVRSQVKAFSSRPKWP